MALCKTTVLKVYQDVMDDVISGVREFFVEDGVDELVLQELKQTWEAKLMASKAVDKHAEALEMKAVGKKAEASCSNALNGFKQVMKQPTVGHVAPNNHVQTAVMDNNNMVPIQITLPAQLGSSDTQQRVLNIHVPASALQGNQLHSVLTGPIIATTMGLPQPIASTLLQQHVNAAFQSQQAVSIGPIVSKPLSQVDGCDGEQAGSSKMSDADKKLLKLMQKFDGHNDTTDEEEDGSDDDDDEDEVDDDKEEEDHELDEGGPEEEPLNSEDDVTDEDPSDLFDTDNVVVCQYDKITRSRNKWKFYLKDGIMNLEGDDFVFQKATGDAEW